MNILHKDLLVLKKSQQAKLKELMDNQQPIYLEDCEIKKAKRGNSMEILLKSSTTIHKSPKKSDTTVFNFQEYLALDSLESKDVYDKVSVRVKVLQLLDTVPTPIGKKIQEIIISDGTATSKLRYGKVMLVGLK